LNRQGLVVDGRQAVGEGGGVWGREIRENKGGRVIRWARMGENGRKRRKRLKRAKLDEKDRERMREGDGGRGKRKDAGSSVILCRELV
jgi:hypothetical protein